MRVLFVTHSFPRTVGDAPGSFLLRLARALAAQAVEVHVVAPAGPGLADAETMDGIPVTRFRYARRASETLAYTGNMVDDVRRSWAARAALLGLLLANRAAVTRAVKRLRPDVVHAHWWFPGGLCALAASSRRAPLVTTLHGTDVRLARSARPARPLFRRVVAGSAAVTTVSRFLAAEAAAIVPGMSPVVAPMPAATELFRPPVHSGSRDGLLFVGRLNEQKGLANLLEALPLVRATPRLDVVGDGPDRARLVALAASLGLAERVRWHGPQTQSQLAPLYGRASVVVVPSRDEGLGLVAVEALLCETPVVAWRSGGLVDVVEHGVSGRLAPPGDLRALADAIDALAANPELAAGLGRAGRARALATFSPESAAAQYRGVYESALHHSQSSRVGR